jgi:FeS assembly SUF system protein
MTEKIQESEDGATATEAAVAAPAIAEPGEPQTAAPLSPEHNQLKVDLVSAIKTVFDPEIPVDIYELGLIYRLDVDEARNIEVDMTLTAPGCPVAGDMPGWVQNAISAVPGVGGVKVNLVFDPPWDPSRMSDEARLALNMF